MRSSDEWERHTHLDLAEFTVAELFLERDRVRLRLQIDRKPDGWLLERLDEVEALMLEVPHGAR
jgi:hypothetical protein